jgi:hypothetical protein
MTTDLERFDSALNYIETKVSMTLAAAVKTKIGAAKLAAGAAISLKGEGYWHSGSDAQHKAVRGLLLCQHAFLKAPDVSPFVSTPIDLKRTLKFYKGKTEDSLKVAIGCYEKRQDATREKLAHIAESELLTTAPNPYETSTRADIGMGTPTPICFHAVRQWLYKAGFVSLRWLAKVGFELGPNNCNTVLGMGSVIDPKNIDAIPRGYLFNFHADGDQSTNHWGIALGKGLAAGSNTTASSSKVGFGGTGIVETDFSKGGTTYGVFTIASAFEVCRYKYQRNLASKGGIAGSVTVAATWKEPIIRQIDPVGLATYY